MTREELQPKAPIQCTSGQCYDKDEADRVMDAMEARIKELEEALSNAVTCGNIALEQAKKLESQLPKWISVKDRLPKEGEEVIVLYTCWKHEYQQVAMFESGEFIDLGGCALSPTHWMPLPPPPTTEDSSAIEK